MASLAPREREIAAERKLLDAYQEQWDDLQRADRRRKRIAQSSEDHYKDRYARSEPSDPKDLGWFFQVDEKSNGQNVNNQLHSSLGIHTRAKANLLLDLQPQLCGFCLTSVKLLAGNDAATSLIESAKSFDESQYEIRGHFFMDSRCHACIRITLNHNRENKMGSVTSLECSVEDRDSTDNYAWLTRESRLTPDGLDALHLAAWVTRLDKYLLFDQRRKKLDTELGSKGVAMTHVQAKTFLSVPLIALTNTTDDDGPDHAARLELLWTWKWKIERDVLRLRCSLPGLRQADLDALVDACHHRCDDAVRLLLPSSLERRDGTRQRM